MAAEAVAVLASAASAADLVRALPLAVAASEVPVQEDLAAVHMVPVSILDAANHPCRCHFSFTAESDPQAAAAAEAALELLQSHEDRMTTPHRKENDSPAREHLFRHSC